MRIMTMMKNLLCPSRYTHVTRTSRVTLVCTQHFDQALRLRPPPTLPPCAKCFSTLDEDPQRLGRRERRNHERAEKKLYDQQQHHHQHHRSSGGDDSSSNKMNKIVDYMSKLQEQASRPEIMTQEIAQGSQGLSEQDFRQQILEKRLDIEFGTGGQPVIASTSREKIVDEQEYEKRVPLNQDLNF